MKRTTLLRTSRSSSLKHWPGAACAHQTRGRRWPAQTPRNRWWLSSICDGVANRHSKHEPHSLKRPHRTGLVVDHADRQCDPAYELLRDICAPLLLRPCDPESTCRVEARRHIAEPPFEFRNAIDKQHGYVDQRLAKVFCNPNIVPRKRTHKRPRRIEQTHLVSSFDPELLW